MALKLSMICGAYDRSRALLDGTVQPRGIDLDIQVADAPGEPVPAHGPDYDICELYTGSYIADLPRRELGYVAIPIFVKRMFRHSYIYVSKRARLRAPSELNGRRIGIQRWLTTTGVWARGLLAEEYGLDLSSVEWVASGEEFVGSWRPPSWAKISRLGEHDPTVHDLLAAGELDAAITTGAWAPDEHPNIAFLFPDYAEREREYYRRTRFFPIMHTLVISEAVLRDEPWVARAMFDAWQESKQKCYEWLRFQRVHQTSLWYRALWEEERRMAGEDFYPWGFQRNEAELDKLLEYSYEQGLTPRRYQPRELFFPALLDT